MSGNLMNFLSDCFFKVSFMFNTNSWAGAVGDRAASFYGSGSTKIMWLLAAPASQKPSKYKYFQGKLLSTFGFAFEAGTECEKKKLEMHIK
jgi:hypothetical protein